MKKSTKSVILILTVIAMIACAIVPLCFVANAADAAEATLTVETVNYNSSGKENGTTAVSSESGSLQAMLEKLTALSPEVSTRYTVKLLSDASQTAALSISANEFTEVRLELDGYSMSYTGTGSALTLSGTGATVRVNGGYEALGERGRITVTSLDAVFATIADGSDLFLDVKNVDATYLGRAFIDARGGTSTIRESSVSYLSSGASAVISASGAKANLKYVDVVGSDALTALSLSESLGYIEGGHVEAGSLVISDATVSSALLASVDSETVTAFKVGSAETVTYVLGGKLHVSADIATGTVSASNLYFYYADGTMTVQGGDPTLYGIQSGCSFTESEGLYTLGHSSTSVAMATTAAVGQAPVVSTHSSFVKGMGADGIGRAANSSAEVSTVCFNTLLKDAVIASAANVSGCENLSVIIDLNGYDLTWESTATKNFTTYTGNFHYSYDGTDKDGNRGTVTSNSQNMMFFYARQNNDSGFVNVQTVTRITDINFVVTNMGAAGGNYFINVNSGSAYVENVDITYTGTQRAADGQTYVYLMNFDHSAGPHVPAHLENVNVRNTDVNGVNVYGVLCTEAAEVYAESVNVTDVYAAFKMGASATLTVMNSKIAATGMVITGSGAAHVYDTEIEIPNGKISDTCAVYLHKGENCSTTVTTDGSSLSGNYITDEDYAMVPVSETTYKLTSGVKSPEPITLPQVFADGMVFQRGKTLNVFGYCDDTEAELKITLGDRVGTASVDENGEFFVELNPINEPTWGLTLTVEQTNSVLENKVVFTDVAVGEVWVMSGQSNAQLQVMYLEDVEEYATLAETLGNIRVYRATASYSLQESKYGSATWDTEITRADFTKSSGSQASAVGYVAVAKLAAELGPDVPVALMHVARGASKIKTWLDYESLAAISPSEAAKYDECVANGTLPDSAHTKIGTVLYNQQIAPLEGFEVAGVMWYQGCGDVNGVALGIEGKSYTEYFTALERVYRRVFGGDSELPFYVMQLAPYTQEDANGAGLLSEFKAEQFDFCRDLDNTYLIANMTDGGVHGDVLFSQGFIHPGRKSTIGNRTADTILATQYDFDLGEAYTHPMPVSVNASGDTLTVTFDTELKLFFGVEPVGFEISSDGVTWKSASGVIDGKSVHLTATGVSAPKYVRYGYGKITAELADGTLVDFLSGQAKYNSTERTLTITKGSTVYVITTENGQIRSMDLGNVTNASGIPLPTFKLEASAE